MRALHRAVDLGVNFFDTADVYGDGHSERLIARLKRERREPIVVATKAGRRLSPHVAEGYDAAHLTRFVERSLKNLETDAIDLLQLHCPPTDGRTTCPRSFGALDDLVRQGKLRYYGVSVERVEEALKAIEFPGVQSVQIIFNLFRQRPAELFFPEAERRRVGILARLPLSSGMLTGRMIAATRASRRRPPRVQPERRELRSRRDVLGRRFRGLAGRRRRPAAARAGRLDAERVRAALDPDGRRGDDGDSWRPTAGASGAELRRRRPAGNPRRRDGARDGTVRRARQNLVSWFKGRIRIVRFTPAVSAGGVSMLTVSGA